MTARHGGRARRGLGTSVSLLVIFIGLFVAMGGLYTVTANTAERVTESRSSQGDRSDRVAGTAINITSAEWDLINSNLLVTVENTGDTTLRVDASDTIVDGNYVGVDDYERVEVEGGDSDLWRPGEELTLEDEDTIVNFLNTPDRITVVSEPGVADGAEVTSV